jgi:signal transduction histidine kinase
VTSEPAPDLAALTGVRSGKRSFYPAYKRSDERMRRAVSAMDSISRVLVRTVEGPRALLEDVVRAAAEHLQSSWMLLGLGHGTLPEVRPRFLAVQGRDRIVDNQYDLPPVVRGELEKLRAGLPSGSAVDRYGWVRVPMVLDGVCVGGLAGLHGLGRLPEEGDLSVLRILASQAAVSMHTSALHEAGRSVSLRAQQLHDEAERRAHDLAEQSAELRRLEQRLLAAHQRELLDTERHRIARELHDSVTQYVLSAGMAVEVCRSDVAAGAGNAELGVRLAEAKDLTRRAVEQLRSAIYALNHPHPGDEPAGLPELLKEVAAQHSQHLAVSLRVEGRPRTLGVEAEQSLARVAGEALFNTAVHGRAARAVVRLKYEAARVRLSVADDGHGDPAVLRRLLRLELAGDSDGRHRGLANMAARAHELGGTLTLRRARLGGVRVEVDVAGEQL